MSEPTLRFSPIETCSPETKDERTDKLDPIRTHAFRQVEFPTKTEPIAEVRPTRSQLPFTETEDPAFKGPRADRLDPIIVISATETESFKQASFVTLK
jgi:hypothetical protein